MGESKQIQRISVFRHKRQNIYREMKLNTTGSQNDVYTAFTPTILVRKAFIFICDMTCITCTSSCMTALNIKVKVSVLGGSKLCQNMYGAASIVNKGIGFPSKMRVP